MRVLLDENVPRLLKGLLAAHEVKTVQEMGWTGVLNGELVARAATSFDVLVTADKNLRYQQNLSSRGIAIIELPTNRWPLLKSMAAEVLDAIASVDPHSSIYLVVEPAVRTPSDL